MPLPSCHISGIFSLSGGYRRAETSRCAEYLSALESPINHASFNISVRKFAPFSGALLEDNSFVFMVAKAALPAGEDGMLDSVICVPFDSPSERPITFRPTQTAFVTGALREVDRIGPIRIITLTTLEYVHGEQQTFDVRFVLSLIDLSSHSLLILTHIRFKYDETSIRWRHMQLPHVGCFITATGVFADVSRDDGDFPVFNLLDIKFVTHM